MAQKGAKGRRKRVMPKDVKDREWKLGNPDYPAYDPDRELSDTEKMHLFTLYKRHDHDTAKAAKAMGITEDVAHAAVMACLRDDPAALNDPDHALRLSYACDQMIARGIVKINENIDNGKLYGRGLVDTIKVAKWLQRSFRADYDKAKEEAGAGSSESELDAQIEEMEKKVADINQRADEAAVPQTPS